MLRNHFPLTRAARLITYSEVIFRDNFQDAPTFGNGSFADLTGAFPTITPDMLRSSSGKGKVTSLVVQFGVQGPATNPQIRVKWDGVIVDPTAIDISSGAETTCTFRISVGNPNVNHTLAIEGSSTGGGAGDLRNRVITATFVE